MRKHEWQPGQVFVFGSNTAGKHLAGAAETAWCWHGAIMGQAEGPMGQSYAIPTRRWTEGAKYVLSTLRVAEIRANVHRFIEYAMAHPDEVFFITALGTGYAKISHKTMAEMFAYAPENCLLPPEWDEFIYTNGVA